MLAMTQPVRQALERDAAADVAVSIYTSRESLATLLGCIDAALASLAAANAGDAVVDVLVNGNAELAEQLAREPRLRGSAAAGTRLRVIGLAYGDKAQTWNRYVHELAPPARAYVFVDGYVRVEAGAVAALVATLAQGTPVMAATGFPRAGRSAAKVAASLLQNGGLHGNLYALTAQTLAEIRHTQLRLPLGLYRTDAVLGAALAYGLDTQPRRWLLRERIAVVPGVRWTLTAARWWHPGDLRGHLRRLSRQAQGALENAAVRDHLSLRGDPVGALPRTASALVLGWAERMPADAARTLGRSLLRRRALRRMRATISVEGADAPARFLFDSQTAVPQRQVEV